MTCFEDFEAVNARLERVLTQYRESPKLLHMARTYLRQAEIIAQAICDLPSKFELETATGDQLTLIGKRLGFPRRQCVCETLPVFGFDCGDDPYGVTTFGFCAEATWIDCSNVGISFVSIIDDELYRKFLKVRIYQTQAYFDLRSLKECIAILWGETAKIMDKRNGRIVIAPGRPLSIPEQSVLQLYPRVLPVALGVLVRFHFGSDHPFGFGEGWSGFCEGRDTGGDPLKTESDDSIMTEAGSEILVDGLRLDPDWLCAYDVKPYDC